MDRQARLPLPPDTAAPSRARRFVAEALLDWQVPDRIDDALLLASELVTNAVEHGSPPATLQIAYREPELLIEVHDASGRLPVLGRLDDPVAERGRGVAIVDAIADSWGVVDIPNDGKAVWCKLALRPSPLTPLLGRRAI